MTHSEHKRQSQGWRHFPYALLRDFHDGDTCEVHVDQGFGGYRRVGIRIYGLSAPEVSGKEKSIGLDALRIAREVAWTHDGGSLEPACELWTWKQSFDRYVGRIVIAGKFDLAIGILALGGGRAWDGKTERPTFEQFPVVDVDAEVAEYQRILARDFRAPGA